MKTDNRLPCPSCGNHFVDVWVTVERPKEYHCECRYCHYCGITKRSARAAIKAWNRECASNERN
jgi:hypothetical protein